MIPSANLQADLNTADDACAAFNDAPKILQLRLWKPEGVKESCIVLNYALHESFGNMHTCRKKELPVYFNWLVLA